MSPYIMTSSGRKFHLLDMSQNVFDIEEIADALSKLCRFTGHTSDFYSVAEHSARVARLVPVGYQLDALLHDAPEAYLGDVASPLRALLPDYQDIYAQVEDWLEFQAAQAASRVVVSFHWDVVKAADQRMFVREAHRLFSPGHWPDLKKLPLSEQMPKSTSGWKPAMARSAFLRAYRYALAGRPVV